MVNLQKNSIIEEIVFSADEFKLKGYLHLPPLKNPPFIIGCHGLFSDKNSPKQIELARHCNQRNMALITGVAVKAKHRLGLSHRWMRAAQT
jgi:hypothetical protein